jgi:hypothetical protein
LYWYVVTSPPDGTLRVKLVAVLVPVGPPLNETDDGGVVSLVQVDVEALAAVIQLP